MHRFFHRVLVGGAAFAISASACFAFTPAHALTYPVYFDADTTLRLSGPSYDLTILAGSHMDSPTDTITVTPTTFTVTMGGTGHLAVRWQGPTPGRFPNDGGLPQCTYVGGNNDLSINGPVTVTFTPSTATSCAAAVAGGGGGGGGTNTAPSVSVASPNGGEVLEGGASVNLLWTVGGTQVTGTRLSYSADNGSTWTEISSAAYGGFLAWTLPMVATTQAKIRAEALVSGGGVGASDSSDSTFTVTVPQGVTGPYDSEDVTGASPNINQDVGLKDVPPPENPLCVGGSLIKLPTDNDPKTAADSAVYYCGNDGKRYVFPNFWIFSTWYSDFSSVKVIPAETMSQIKLGGNVTYRPGVRMVKIQSDPRVYAVAAHGTLRWVATEAAALRIYGANWNKLIDDVPDAFFFDYAIGEPLY